MATVASLHVLCSSSLLIFAVKLLEFESVKSFSFFILFSVVNLQNASCNIASALPPPPPSPGLLRVVFAYWQPSR